MTVSLLLKAGPENVSMPVNLFPRATTDHRIQTVAVLESWISDEITDNEVPLLGYQTVRYDHHRHGGEVIITSQKNILLLLVMAL